MQHPLTHPRRNQVSAHLGMLIALGSWTMLFVAFFFNYTVIRVQAPDWFTPSIMNRSLPWATLSSGVILSGSFVYIMSRKAMIKKQVDASKMFLRLSIWLGLLFFCLQAFLWVKMVNMGMGYTRSQANALFYVLTGVHGAHILGALGSLIWLYQQICSGKVHGSNILGHDLVGAFWHFLAGVWIIMYGVLFFIR
ncbi:MAG: cytochrome c oxidase subunit 3 [Candidatus Omnitrophica bacterium]|nr:cytochrome c oxidase subunit 3 [Candidatus Omnitrophota bacterium]